MIHEHACELLADRLMDENCRDRGINSTGKPADHASLAHLRPDFFHRLLLERPHGPIAAAAGDVANEIAQERGAMRGVHDFEMELRGVELAILVGNHRNWSMSATSRSRESQPGAG